MPVRRYGSARSCAVRALATLLLLGAHLPVAALSLGDLEVRSALGEPLRLELAIESDHSAGGMPEARLIDADGSEVRTVAGAALGRLRVEVVAIDDIRQRLRIHSSLPAWEPLITLRVEVTQASMRVVRELPILLDPPSAQGDAGQAIEWHSERSQQADANDASAPPVVPAAAKASPTAASIDPPIAQEPRKRPRKDRESSTPASLSTTRPPVPRFQLAAALSSSSRAWLEIDPQPRAQEAVEAPQRTPAATAAPQPASATPEVSATVTKVAIPGADRPVAPAPGEGGSTAPRGLPMGSPWQVFLLMAALAAALFFHARRLRRRKVVRDGPAV